LAEYSVEHKILKTFPLRLSCLGFVWSR